MSTIGTAAENQVYRECPLFIKDSAMREDDENGRDLVGKHSVEQIVTSLLPGCEQLN